MCSSDLTTKATAADVAPMTYIQLPTAMLLGVLIFRDWPDGVALAGSAIIIGAGLYLWHNTRPKREGNHDEAIGDVRCSGAADTDGDSR